MIQPIEVMALDENMNRASGGIAYRSLIWRRRYYECGTFELYVPKNIYKTTWKYIYTNDRPEMGIIETVCATDDVHAWGGIDTVKVSGRFAESLLSRKVLIPSRVTGYGSTGDNVAVSMQWAQEIFGDRFEYLAPDFEGVERPMAPKPSPYGLILYDELKMAEASYRVLYDFTGDTWTVQPWRGLDRTQSQLPIAPDPDEPDVPDEPTIDDLYEPLDYIVSTGEQWIDTGMSATDATTIVIDFDLYDTTYNGNIFGSRESATANNLTCFLKDGTIFLDYRNYEDNRFKVDASSGRMTVSVGAAGCTIGENSYAISGSDAFETPGNVYVCNASGSPVLGTFAKLRLYGWRRSDSTTLTQDLVPKRRIADGAVGLLDLVSEVFYTSASGVAFLAPGELPAGYTRLEYIESTGSQYIDTGIFPNQDTRVVMDAQYIGAASGYRRFFGAYDDVACYELCTSNSAAKLYDTYGANYKTADVNLNERHVLDKNGNVTSVDGAVVFEYAKGSFTAPVTLYLCNLHYTTDDPSYYASLKVWSCQIYQEGITITNDYVPVKNSGGETGLFDLVTMTFCTDVKGVGFVAGPEVTAVAEASTFSLMRTAAASEETTETAVVNSFALFSDQMGTIRDYVAVKDASSYKNTCLIDYEYEEPASWNDDGTPYATPIYEWIPESAGTAAVLVGYQIRYNIKRGTVTARIADDLPDDESYLDLTGTKPPYDGEWSRSQYEPDALPDFPTDMRASYEAFPAALEAEGFKHLQANHPYVEEIDTGELSTGGYLRRWDLGDKVDALLLDIGIDMEARITGVDEVYEGATRSVTPIIGEKKHRRI